MDDVSIDFDPRDGATVVKLGGEIDMANVDDVSRRLLSMPHEADSLVLDLEHLRYIDSAGIRMLFELSEQLARDGTRLVLAVAVDAPVRRVLSITKLDTLVPIRDDVVTAVEAAEGLRS
jgi:anti-anti-sigma factor